MKYGIDFGNAERHNKNMKNKTAIEQQAYAVLAQLECIEMSDYESDYRRLISNERQVLMVRLAKGHQGKIAAQINEIGRVRKMWES